MTVNWWTATRSRVKSMLRGAQSGNTIETRTVVSKQEPDDIRSSANCGLHSLDESALEKVMAQWGRSSWSQSAVIHWTQHPAVQRRLNFLASGNHAKNRFEYFMEKYCAGRMPFERVITLGCGHGELERGLAKYRFASIHEAVDITDAAVHEAAELARQGGLTHIRYEVADLNRIQLQSGAYDVVFGISSIHHVSNLEHLFGQVSRALKPGGYFFLDEFIGPSQFQWTDAQLKAINDAASTLPPEYRQYVNGSGLQAPVRRPGIEEMNTVDPSEAIRSAEIVPLLPQYFDVIEVRGCGGSVLHLLLEGIAGNFVEDHEESMRWLESLFELEDRLIQSGELPHDFAVIVARKKDAIRG